MKNAVTRACAWVVIGIAAHAAPTQAQTTEIYAGGANYVDTPGTSVTASIGAMAKGPDGSLYFTNSAGHLARFNSANGQVSVLPSLPGVENPEFSSVRGMAVDPAGELYIGSSTTLYRVNPATGATTAVATLLEGGPMAFDSQGNLFYVSDNSIRVRRPNGVQELFAGTDAYGFSGDGGPAAQAQFNGVWSLAVAPNDDVYIADTGNQRVRVVSAATGIITTAAGTGVYGYNGDGLPGTQTQLPNPLSLVLDAAGNLYIGTSGYRVLRLDASTGIVSTYAGNGVLGFSGDGGPAVAAQTSYAYQIGIDAQGNVFFVDGEAKRIRMVTASTGIISTAIGNGTNYFCGENVPATHACISEVTGIDVDDADNLILSDWANQRVRMVSAETGNISTVAMAQRGHEPFGIAHDSVGNLIYASFGNTVWRVDAQTSAVTKIAGTGAMGLSGDGGPALQASFSAPGYVAIDANDNIFIADGNNHRIRRIDAATGIITTYAGRFNGNVLGDGGLAKDATFRWAHTIKFDPAGNLVVSDGQNCRIRRIDAATTIITTIVGNGICLNDNSGDGQLATAVSTYVYPAFAFDPMGNIFVSWNNKLRRVDRKTGLISTVATIRTPAGTTFPYNTEDLKFDSQGNLYVIAMHGKVVFRVSGLPVEFPDSTPPVVEPTVLGVSNGAWFRSDVQISWSVEDAESAVSSTSGCGATTITSDTPGVTLTCIATSEGGTTSKSVDVRRDATPPALTFGAATPAPDANGWNQGDVSIPFTTSDATSGVESESAPSPLVISQEGVGITRSVTISDAAGNAAAFTTDPVNIDRTPPIVQPVVTGTLGNDGWYTSDVHVEWSINEFVGSLSSSNGCDAQDVATDTSGVTFTCSVTSAGGTTTQSVTVKRDATPPTLQWGAFSPLPNANGWNKTNVSVPFTRADALSGVASTSATSPLVMSTEGAGVAGQVTVTDNAGNSQTFTTATRNIDKTAPVVAITSPASGSTYGFYQDVVADFACTDVSLVSCTGTNADGALVNTKTAGARTFKVTAKDSVAFTTSVTNNFTVASTFNFDGFLGAAPSPAPNIVRRGSLVPLRWRLPDGNGGYVTSTGSFSSVASTTVSCPSGAVPYNETATGGTGIRFDAATNAFSYNWQSSSSFTGCKQIFITLKDGTQHDLVFKFQ
jgi:hypothetical protein